METFPSRLKSAMARKGITQKSLAEQIGAPKSAISQYLAGKNVPSPDRMKKIADVTEVSVAFLLGAAEPPKDVIRTSVTRITVSQAAKCLRKHVSFVRDGLRLGILPFGYAVPGSNGRMSYYISPARFREEVGPERFEEFFGSGRQ